MAVPVLLQPDNFTPASRTPWGGQDIVRHLKPSLSPQQVGESWELSVEPDYPSRVALGGGRLDDLIQSNRSGWLGDEHTQGRNSTALLVKLLNAAEPLSVQIHPHDDDPQLAADASGKPEAWYILQAAPGAGLYVGLNEHATPKRFAEAITSPGGQAHTLLNFVEVNPGDFFLIDAGTPHAIGPGLLLVEPQRVLPGKRGLTYRYWDWGRRYDAKGQPVEAPAGTPRPLHREDALRVTDWDAPRGQAFLDSVHYGDVPRPLDGPPTRQRLSGQPRNPSQPKPALNSSALRIDRVSGTGTLPFTTENRLSALTVVEGSIQVQQDNGPPLTVPKGQTAALPASYQGQLQLDGAKAILSAAL